MDTTIYSVFPACGKTWLFNHQDNYGIKIMDSDSSRFSWIYIGNRKERNPDFPRNYIEHIKENIGKYDCIFISTHAVVREALEKEGIGFVIVYPRRRCKNEWIGRCFTREQIGETGCGAKAMLDNWEQWIDDCENAAINHTSIVLEPCDYLNSVFIDEVSF